MPRASSPACTPTHGGYVGQVPLAVFRADASPELGTERVERCAALAAVLRARGWRCVLATLPGTRVYAPRAGATLEPLDLASDDPAELARAGAAAWLAHAGPGPVARGSARW